ncbi:MAG TPA: hypothetical protein IAB56_01905 [Candidatus Scybalousia intestinigallinarum]|nr:hypothetical protein [Candidatus Scybalousia intestinigallinarum]
MKKIITLVLLLTIFLGCIFYNQEIVGFIVDNFLTTRKTNTVLINNKYASNRNYQFVQITDDFTPHSKQDIINIYYTVINSGMTDFVFYCPEDYKECINDVNYISNNQSLLSNINNFVQVYNSFSHIETEFDSLGKVEMTIHHTYTDEQITEIDAVVDELMASLLTPEITTEEKIKAIHDYIINNTKYDKDRSDNKIKKYHSDIAYGALIEHYAICGGYADSMKIFLDRLGIENFKIASENHIWNFVKVNGTWYHLDLTWDDPVTDTGEDILEYDYFLITTDELLAKENDQHIYDKNVYIEAAA